MGECQACGKDMNDVDGCDPDRTITFNDGDTVDPIPFGESDRGLFSYGDMVESFEEDIEAGGRGNLSEAVTREQFEEWKDNTTPEEYNNRPCHDCGAEQGEYHHPGCDMEECPKCGGQYFICDCVTFEKERIWNPA